MQCAPPFAVVVKERSSPWFWVPSKQAPPPPPKSLLPTINRNTPKQMPARRENQDHAPVDAILENIFIYEDLILVK
jgi:hypothetical protein